jgi:hypothetical protein
MPLECEYCTYKFAVAQRQEKSALFALSLEMYWIVMASLKAFCKELGEALRLPPESLYHRQRALVRAGVLPEPEGRGRGKGLDATPDTVAIILVALLATDSLTETDDRVKALARAKSVKGRCPLTGAGRFSEAVAAILNVNGVPAPLLEIRVWRATPRARIYFQLPDQSIAHSDFGTEGPARLAIDVNANVSAMVLKVIRDLLRSSTKEHSK